MSFPSTYHQGVVQQTRFKIKDADTEYNTLCSVCTWRAGKYPGHVSHHFINKAFAALIFRFISGIHLVQHAIT